MPNSPSSPPSTAVTTHIPASQTWTLKEPGREATQARTLWSPSWTMASRGPIRIWCKTMWVFAAVRAFPPGKQWDSHEDDENGGGHGGFPGGSAVDVPPANAGEAGATPGSERSPREGNGNWLQYSCLGSPMDRGACRSTVHLHTVHGVTKESDTAYLLNNSKRRRVTENQLLCIAPILHKIHSQRTGIRR